MKHFLVGHMSISSIRNIGCVIFRMVSMLCTIRKSGVIFQKINGTEKNEHRLPENLQYKGFQYAI